jgi:thiamine phosphate synthase YjbQ (UPF0047 family)
MKHFREELWFNTPNRRDYINITDQVQSLVTQSGIANGLCLVNAMHITASVYINDDEQGLLRDYDQWLEKLARTRRQASTSTTEPARTTPTPT